MAPYIGNRRQPPEGLTLYLRPAQYSVEYDENVFDSVQINEGYMGPDELSIRVKDGVEQANTIIRIIRNSDNQLIGTIQATVNIEPLEEPTGGNEPTE